jgi:hypothetical protein
MTAVPLAEALALHRHLAVSVDPQLPPGLIDAAALARIHGVARQLPAALTDFFGFESRLGEPGADADFLVCAKAQAARNIVAAQPDAAPLPAGRVWDDLARFGERWADSASPCAAVHNMWMEFDLPAGTAPSGGVPAPSVFLGGEFLPGGSAPPEWLVDEALPLCQGRAVAPALRESLARAMAVVPAHAHGFQVGLMLGRAGAGDALRLCLRGLQRDDLAPLLRALEWPGDAAELLAAWDFAAPWAVGLDLDLDLLPHTGPKLGLECSFGYANDSVQRVRTCLDGLVARGACLPAKRDALLAWPRAFHQRGQGREWPLDLLAGALLQPETSLSMFARWVYHIKIDVQPGKPWVAKAYLAVAHHWLNARVLEAARTASTPSSQQA